MSIRAFRSIRTKLVLSLGVPLLASYIALLAADFFISSRAAILQMQSIVLERAEGAARVIDSRLMSVTQVSHALSMMASSAAPDRARFTLEEALNNRWVTSATLVIAPQGNAGAPTTYVAHREARADGRGGFGGRGRIIIETAPTPAWYADAMTLTAGRWDVDNTNGPASRRTARYVEPLGVGSAAGGAIGLDVSLAELRTLRPGRPLDLAAGTPRTFSMGPASGPTSRPNRDELGGPRDDLGRNLRNAEARGEGGRREGGSFGTPGQSRGEFDGGRGPIDGGQGGPGGTPRGEGRNVELRDGGRREGGPPTGGPMNGGPPNGGPPDGGPRDGGPREGGPATELLTDSLPVQLAGISDRVVPLATSQPSTDEIFDFALFDATGRLVMPATSNQENPSTQTIFETARSVGSPGMAETAREAQAGHAGIVSVAGLGQVVMGLPADADHWLAMSPIPSTGWFLVTAVAESQYVQPVLARLVQRALFLAAGLLLMVVVVLLISVRMSRRLERLDAAVGRLATGDLDTPMPPVGSPDEIGRLTQGFATMTRDLRERVAALTTQTAAREKVEGELRIARQIQVDLLPKTFPPFPDRTDFELHAINEPARQVAGDFYDFFFNADGTLTVVVADVSGKGVPAALLMAVTRTLVRSLAGVDTEPAAIIRSVNAALAHDTATYMFVTMFLCRYDPRSGRISYVNAGHPPPIRIGPDAPPTPCCDHNSPLVGIDESGVMGDFDQREETLAPGETLLIYTDGVLDAPGDATDYLELPGLLDVLRDQGHVTARAVCERLINVLIHNRSTPRRDDTTVLAIRRSADS